MRSYAWSSYRSYIGLSPPLGFLTYGPVLAMMDKRQRRQASVYRRFVEAGIRDIDAAFIETKSRSRYCIGSDDHLERITTQYQEMASGSEHPEDIAFQKISTQYSVETVLTAVSKALEIPRESFMVRQHNSWLRPLCSRALQVYSGLSQREIGHTLSIGSGAAVSKQLRLLGEAMAQDKHVRACWLAIEKQIEKS